MNQNIMHTTKTAMKHLCSRCGRKLKNEHELEYHIIRCTKTKVTEENKIKSVKDFFPSDDEDLKTNLLFFSAKNLEHTSKDAIIASVSHKVGVAVTEFIGKEPVSEGENRIVRKRKRKKCSERRKSATKDQTNGNKGNQVQCDCCAKPKLNCGLLSHLNTKYLSPKPSSMCSSSVEEETHSTKPITATTSKPHTKYIVPRSPSSMSSSSDEENYEPKRVAQIRSSPSPTKTYLCSSSSSEEENLEPRKVSSSDHSPSRTMFVSPSKSSSSSSLSSDSDEDSSVSREATTPSLYTKNSFQKAVTQSSSDEETLTQRKNHLTSFCKDNFFILPKADKTKLGGFSLPSP